jgi:5-methylcytosine-specific restriction endonuclease McrA
MSAITSRRCLRDPIPEIVQAASLLEQATCAHIGGQYLEAAELICCADIDSIREWTESLWGRNSPYVLYRRSTASLVLPEPERQKLRMPTLQERHKLHFRDGYHCRFCGIPVIRKEIRQRIRKAYPLALRWGRRNKDCHAAFQAMWAQYDHVVPHAKGGTNDLYNLVVTCAPCNYARMSYTLEEVGLLDPRMFDAVRSNWDGLERFPLTLTGGR